MKNLVVIFGGKSTEHDISILSCMQVFENLDSSKYNIIPIYITKEGKWLYGKKLSNLQTFKNFTEKGLKEVSILPSSNYLYIKKFGGFKKYLKVDCALLVMHGLHGEDGTIQGLLELSNIAYTSCGVMASSIGMSKLMQKIVFTGLEIPVVPYFTLTKLEYEKVKKFKLDSLMFPVVVKPDKLGSSIGISYCKNITQLRKALDLAFKFDDIVVVEKGIKRLKEINISVMGDSENIKTSITEEPISSNHILTFVDKYMSGVKSSKNSKIVKKDDKILNLSIKNDEKLKKLSGSPKLNQNGMQNLSRIVPAKISDKIIKQVEEYAKIIFKTLNCKGVIRIDYIYDLKDKKLYVNEVNIIPGSLAYYLWEYNGLSFKQELVNIIDIAIKDNLKNSQKTFVFESNVIKY